MFKHLVAVLFLGIALAGDAYAQSPHACVIESNFTGIFDAEQGNYTLIVIPGAAATLRANCTSSVNSYAWNPGNAQTASIPIVAPTVPGASAAYTLTGCDSVTRTCGTPVTITVQAAAATAPDCVLTASPNPATSGQSVTFTANCDAARPLPAKINYVDLSGTARSSSTLTFAATAPVVTVSTVRHVFYEAVSATNLAGPQRVLQVTVNPASAKARLQLIGLEVTQVVQDLRNSVPLVEAKPTVVRAHLRNLGTGNPTVDGQLLGNRIESNGSRTSLGTLSPSNAGRSIRVPQAPSRASIDDSFYFELPESWRTGRIELEFRGINTEMTCSEPDAAADCKVTVLFSPVSPLSIKFIGLTYNDAGGVAHTPTLGDVFQVATEFLAHYPINRIDGDLGIATIKANACLGFSVMAGVRKELNSLRNTDCKSDSCKQFYQGLLADQSSCSPAPGANGESDLPGAASVVFYPTDRIGTRAHEQGHALGFKHVDYTGDGKSGDEGCGDADRKAIACSKLEGDGTLSISKDQYAPNTAYGFDANNLSPQRIYAPETADFMSYGVRRWPSRSNYVQLFNKFKVAGGTDGIAVKGKSVTATLTVLIDGTVQFDGSAAEIGSVYVAMSPGTVTLPAAGTYAVRFENAQGATLATYSFEPVEGSESPTTGNFSLVLPWDATAKRIVLLRNGQPVASRQASASAPVVTVTSPNGGESLVGASTTFTWTATH